MALPVLLGATVPSVDDCSRSAPPQGWLECLGISGWLPSESPAGLRRNARLECVGIRNLGEINDSQELAWRKSIEVLEPGRERPRTLALFPDDRAEGLLPDGAIIRLKLSELRLCRPRQWGGCWLVALTTSAVPLNGAFRRGVVEIEPRRIRAAQSISETVLPPVRN